MTPAEKLAAKCCGTCANGSIAGTMLSRDGGVVIGDCNAQITIELPDCLRRERTRYEQGATCPLYKYGTPKQPARPNPYEID